MRRVLLALTAALCLALPATAGAARLIDIGDFNQPIYLAAPPGDSSRLMIAQKAGEIRVLHGGAQSLFLNVAAAVGGIQYGATDEQGLFSMAFAPDYATSGRFYVYYTAAGGASNRVDEFRVSGNASVADPASRRPVISVPHTSQTNHNGGQIAFGPDGFLYIAPGDGALDANTAQDVNTLLGKVLRIDPRSGATYGIPPGNPYAGPTPGADEVYHRGLRNPFRFSFDRANGDLVIGDVGGSLQEEVTLVPAGTPSGRNFGWPVCEGTSCTGPPPADHFGPALRYTQGSPKAVTGGVVVRDAALPELFGRYLYADFYDGQIRAASPVPQAGAGHAPTTGLDVNNLAAFGQDNGNCIYVVSLAGNVFRLAANDGPAPVPCGTAASGAPTPETAQDRTAPRLLTRTPRRQRVRRQKGLVAYTRCSNEACNLSMTARLRIGRLSYPLIRVRRPLVANTRVKVRAKLTSRAARALRRALRRRTPARVDVAFRARDAAGNASPLRRAKVRVRR